MFYNIKEYIQISNQDIGYYALKIRNIDKNKSTPWLLRKNVQRNIVNTVKANKNCEKTC